MKRAITVLLLIAAIGAGGGAYYVRHSGPDVSVSTAQVTRGDIVDSVAATGALQAVISVTVGSQVSGNIAWLGADFNSIVHKDQVIAKIDPTLFEGQVLQTTANLANAKAQLGKDQVNLTYQKLTYQRNLDLRQRGIISQDAFDASKTAADQGAAQVELDKAQIEQAEAQLGQAKTNLEHTIIASPIDGIVTQRSVDVGQTVQASMTAPQLFVIAEDLKKMQVSASIDESDVGRVRPGQDVLFRVDAYPGEEFHGTVAQIRLNPVVVNNVTTYATMINVPNNDLRLKPGMTANLKVQVAQKSGVLRVSNTALRFRPSLDVFLALNEPVPPEAQGFRGGRGAGGGGRIGSGGGTGPGSRAGARAAESGQDRAAEKVQDRAGEKTSDPPSKKPQGASPPLFVYKPRYGPAENSATIDALFAPMPSVESRGRVWVFVNHQLKPVSVRLGITDGSFTELVGNDLPGIREGTEVVTNVTGLGSSRLTAAGTGNPLMPQRGGFRGR